MNCLDCQEILQRRLDGDTIATSPELDHHLATCPACRSNHAGAQLLLDGARHLPRTPLPPGLHQQLVAAVLHDRALRQRRTRTRLWITVGMAAAILILASTGYVWLPTQKPDVRPVAENKSPAPEELTPPLAQTMDDARNAVANLTDRLTKQSKDQAQVLIAAAPMEIPMAQFPGVPPLEDPIDPAATRSFLQAGQGLSEGFTTVTRNARRAVDYFVKEMPSLETTAN